jgi:hypothetical protein
MMVIPFLANARVRPQTAIAMPAGVMTDFIAEAAGTLAHFSSFRNFREERPVSFTTEDD